MSSINPHFTFQYSQPEEYRFSHDSVFLARWVFEKYQGQDLSGWQGLDLCAGSGIVGLDFLFHLLKEEMRMQSFDFVEVQDVYRQHFLRNKDQLPTGRLPIRWIEENYQNFLQPKGYDLILCNPPYFRPGQGKLSPSEFKNRCRFFIDSDYLQLLQCLNRNLKAQGKAYVLLRDLQDHGWSPLEEAQEQFGSFLQAQVVTQIRGTDVVCFTKS